jgi:hypothetical protein
MYCYSNHHRSQNLVKYKTYIFILTFPLILVEFCKQFSSHITLAIPEEIINKNKWEYHLEFGPIVSLYLGLGGIQLP